jgi:hypothetical protein
VIGSISAGGVPVKGAVISFLDKNAKIAKKITCDQYGHYRVYNIQQGTYTVQVSRSGFKTDVIRNVAVTPGRFQLNAELQSGDSGETVQLDWADSKVRQATSHKSAAGGTEDADLLSSRNFHSAAGTAKGVTGVVNDASAVGVASSTLFFVGGSQQMNVTFDGAEVFLAENPNPDSATEHKVESWSYSAGPNRYAGVNLSINTKKGTKEYHGSAFEYDRNDIFNANDWFRNQQGKSRPILKQNQFGYTVGGPILQGKLFFFNSYQGTRQSNGIDLTGNASAVETFPFPTDATSRGSKAAIGAAMCPANHSVDPSIYETNFYSTYSSSSVEVDCTGNNINDVSMRVLNLKLANGDWVIPSSGTSDYLVQPFSIPTTYAEDQTIFNLDYKLTPKNTIAARTFISHPHEIASFDAGRTSLPGAPTKMTYKYIYETVRWDTAVTDKFHSSFRVSGQRLLTATGPATELTTNSALGITSLTSAVDMFDTINIYKISTLGASNTVWQNIHNNGLEFAETISYDTKNSHITAGAEFENRQYNVLILGAARGSLTFETIADFLVGRAGCTATTLSSTGVCDGTNGTPFSNIYQSVNASASGVVSHAYRYRDMSAYVQDSVKLAPNLKAEVGMRWERFGWPTDSTGNMTVFSPTYSPAYQAGVLDGTSFNGYLVPKNFKGPLASGVSVSKTNTIIERRPDLFNLAPRIGINWNPIRNKALMVRAGYGVFYDIIPTSSIESQTAIASPYGVLVGATGTDNVLATFADPYPNRSLGNNGWGTGRTYSYDSATDTATGSNLSMIGFDPEMRIPQTQKWNFEIYTKLPGDVDLTTGYVGAHSIRLYAIDHYINMAQKASAAGPINGITDTTLTNIAGRVPYLGFGAAGLNMAGTDGSALHNALQVEAKKRYRGVFLSGNYAFTKTITNVSTSSSIGGYALGNPLDHRGMYFVSSRPHRVTLTYGYTLPFRFEGTLSRKLLQDWSMNGNWLWQSGAAITVYDTRAGTAYGMAANALGTYAAGFNRHNITAPGTDKQRQANGWFKSGAFTAPAYANSSLGAASGTDWGTAGTSNTYGPHQNNANMTINKRCTLFEDRHPIQMELRTELYNAFNHENFSNPGANANAGTFGKVTTSSVNSRIIQIGMKLSY